ncbi:tetratricopeptide repeat protein [Alloacidobacterium dinghuense]|uniref:Tetratricopeptide repeat protein n=1 Tax=Alloacidobacterium dinghuense TaxID=2763107 RepID=A0A7G8BJ59_9BACT|nr:tetratricopeptide repeat protein [Alloacidobacterium dinghuense]QNI32579.1 tetratricopeptide repeat protein [Alloacidobacterium dinghuense]
MVSRESKIKVRQSSIIKASRTLLLLICSLLPIAHAISQTSPVGPIVHALQNHQFDEALTLSDSALKQAPEDKRLWTLQGMAYSGKNEPASALKAFEHALTLDSSYLPALEGAAQIEFQAGSPKAKAFALQILAQRPTDPTSHAMLGFLEYREKNCTDAVSDFERGSQALANQPNGLGAYAACLAMLSRYDESIPVFQQALNLQPDSQRIRLNLAIAQWKANRASDALATLQPALDSSPPEENALLLAANIDESTNDTSHAVQLLRKAILANTKNVDAYLNFASISFDHASMQVGIDILNAGLTQLPKEARLYVARGVLHAQLGQFSNAASDFETANRLDPNLSFTGVAEGLVESQEHKSSEALSTFRAAAKAHPDDALTQYLLAEALSQQGQTEGTPEYKEAVTAAERAAKLDPHMVTAHDLLATLYLQNGQTQFAVRESRAALAIDPKDQQAIYHLILALRKTDEKDQVPALLKQLTDLRTAAQTEGTQKKRYQLEEIPASSPATSQ